MLYAGVRPERVARVVSLDGFGIPAEGARARAGQAGASGSMRCAMPPAFRAVCESRRCRRPLQKNNPRLSRDHALFLAGHWARVERDGSARLVSDPRHKLPTATVYRMEEIIAVWKRVRAPALWVAATESFIPNWLASHPEGEAATDALSAVRARIAHVPGATLASISEAGHMLHLDRPDAVAALIEPFFAAPGASPS